LEAFDFGMHKDFDGIDRILNQWGFNSFATQDGAEQSARHYAKSMSHRFIWRLADGTYDFSAQPSPVGPGYPAELVNEIDVQ
jgi:hypothetical protein